MSEERKGTVPYVTRRHYGLGLDKGRAYKIRQKAEQRKDRKGEGRLGCNHTNTTGSHVSSNHNRAFSVLELLQDPVTFVLLFVTVDSC